MDKPKLIVHRFNESNYLYEKSESIEGERITNHAGMVKEQGIRWTGLNAGPESLLTGMVVNGIDLTPEGVRIFISKAVGNHGAT